MVSILLEYVALTFFVIKKIEFTNDVHGIKAMRCIMCHPYGRIQRYEGAIKIIVL
jgi:hypothetical protein